MRRNVPTVAKRLRRAAGKRVRILGMTYYDPFLALYLKGDATNRAIATASVAFADQFNGRLASAYRRRKIRVVDVARAFETHDTALTTLAPFGSLPTNVARVCRYTWMCTPRQPNKPDIHANAAGYKLIARTFARRLR